MKITKMDLTNVYIGFDRDGTLESKEAPVPRELMRLFATLRGRGAKLFIASGRSYAKLQDFCTRIDLDPWLFCAENGGHIVLPEHGLDWFCGHEYPDFKRFLEIVDTLPLPPHRTEAKRLVWSKVFDADVLPALRLLENCISTHQLKLNIFCYPSHSGTIEVLPLEVDKMEVLKYLPASAVVHYIGDGENDLNLMSSLRIIPHAVFNAHPSVKKCVNNRGGLVSRASVGTGVYEVLQKLFF